MNISSALGGLDCAQQMQNTSKPPPPSQQNFDASDTNEDVIVSATEFLAALSLEGIETTQASNMFSSMDANRDGNLSKDENEQAMQQRRDKMESASSPYGDSQTGSGSNSLLQLLSSLSESTSDQETAAQLKTLLEKMQHGGY
jgi:Ca2+-binding EF-hand superfamily protein